MWWSSGSGHIKLNMTRQQAESASHQGQCDDDVACLAREPKIARQLARINTATLRDELREYGAWDDGELADHKQNLQRLVWIAAGDIVEGR